GSYTFDGIVVGQQGPNAAGQVLAWEGPVISFGRCFTESNAVGNTSVTDQDIPGALAWVPTTPAWGHGVIFYIRFCRFFTVSVGTSFGRTAGGGGSNANTWTVAVASFMTIESVAQTS